MRPGGGWKDSIRHDPNSPHEVDRFIRAGLCLFFGFVLVVATVVLALDLYLYRFTAETISRRAWHVGHLHPWVKYLCAVPVLFFTVGGPYLWWHLYGDKPIGYKDTDKEA